MWWLLVLIIPYLFILIYVWTGLCKIKPFDIPSDKTREYLNPRISVLIAVKNEENSICNLLNCLSKQEYLSSEYEVLIIDDHSIDDTWAVAEKYCQGKDNFHLLNNKGKGKKIALNTGLDQASGELIITTDADCYAKPGWLRHIAAFYMHCNPDLILGPIKMINDKGLLNRINDLEFLSLQGITAGSAIINHPVMANGANLAFKKTAVSDYINIIRPEILSGDDMFLLQYIKKHKGSIFWIESDEAIIQTKGETSIRNFISQRARWAGKSIKLTDRDTRILALVTFLTNIIILALLLLGIFSPELLKQAVGLYILKSIPDFLILHKITGMRSKRTLLWFFIPAQLFYPLYILLVSVIGMVNSGRWRRVKYRAS